MDRSKMLTVGKVVSLLVMFFSLVSQPATAQLTASFQHRRPDSADIGKLRQIEQKVLPPTLIPGPPKHGEIVDYYCDANAELRDQLVEARLAFASGKGFPYRAMTVVAGSAGIGKPLSRARSIAISQLTISGNLTSASCSMTWLGKDLPS